MSNSSTHARLVIDTHEFYKTPVGDEDLSYVYPVYMCSSSGMTAIGGSNTTEYTHIPDDISVELVQDTQAKVIDLPTITTRGIAAYIRTARWDQPETNCETFAWQVSGITAKRLAPEADFEELTDASDLAAGDLLSVGTVTHPLGLAFLEVIDMVHWAVYLADGMALNVTGRAGILAATPIKNFAAIYTGAKAYKVTDYAS